METTKKITEPKMIDYSQIKIGRISGRPAEYVPDLGCIFLFIPESYMNEDKVKMTNEKGSFEMEVVEATLYNLEHEGLHMFLYNEIGYKACTDFDSQFMTENFHKEREKEICASKKYFRCHTTMST